MKQIFLLLFASIFLFQCKKEEEAPQPKINVDAITKTNATGEIIGAADLTDWQINDQATEEEKGLFTFADTLDYQDISDTLKVSIHPVYPNPFGSSSNWELKTNSPVVFKIVLVDEFLKRKVSFAMKAPEGISTFNFDFSSLTSLSTGVTYRMYYSFYGNDRSTKYFGHGDILK